MMTKKQEAPKLATDPKSGVPICQYCKLNMRCVGSHYGIKHYVCKEEHCGRGDAKIGRPQRVYDNEGFSARP